jgi:hypothetical protein
VEPSLENIVFYIENWLNSSVSSSTGYAPIELLSANPRPDVFRNLLKRDADHLPRENALADKLIKAYASMKLRADRRNQRRKPCRTRWNPKLRELVLLKSRNTSDALQGITSKFQLPHEGPYPIHRKTSPSTYELEDAEGKIRGLFNIKHLKSYLAESIEEEEEIDQAT